MSRYLLAHCLDCKHLLSDCTCEAGPSGWEFDDTVQEVGEWQKRQKRTEKREDD